MGRGVSVRNIKAFQVLQTVWLRSNSQLITSTILDVILSLYQQDPANYFILLPQNTIRTVCQGGLSSDGKPASNIGRFFRIVEWVGLNLGYMIFDELKWVHGQLTECSVSNDYIKVGCPPINQESCQIFVYTLNKATFKCLEKLLRAKRAYKDLIIECGFVQTSSKLLGRNPELDQLICTTVKLCCPLSKRNSLLSKADISFLLVNFIFEIRFISLIESLRTCTFPPDNLFQANCCRQRVWLQVFYRY